MSIETSGENRSTNIGKKVNKEKTLILRSI